MSEILLFGGSGKLGQVIREFAGIDLYSPTHAECDITDSFQVKKIFDLTKPKVVINAAALVGTKECETDRERAWRVNVNGALNIASSCQNGESRYIFISSAAIFDGSKGLYNEEDPPTPSFYYAITKVAAEQSARMVRSHTIVRLDFFPRGSLKYSQVFSDHYTSKISVDDAARKVLMIALSDYQGVINIGQERKSLYEILKPIFPHIEPIKIADSPMPDFPKDISLDLSTWRRNFE